MKKWSQSVDFEQTRNVRKPVPDTGRNEPLRLSSNRTTGSPWIWSLKVIPYVHRTQLCTSRNYESLAYSCMFALVNVGGGLFNFDKICLQRKQDDVYKSVSNDERSNLFCVCLLLGKRRYQGTNCSKQSDCLDQTVYYNLST